MISTAAHLQRRTRHLRRVLQRSPSGPLVHYLACIFVQQVRVPKGIIGSVYFLDRERITELVERYWKGK